MFAAFYMAINTARKQQSANIFRNIENVVAVVESAYKNFSGSKKNLEKFINEIDKKTGIRITIIDFNGIVVMDSEKDPLLMENHSDRPEFKQAMEIGYGRAIRWSPTLDRFMVYYAKKCPQFVIRGSLYKENLSLKGDINLENFYRISLILFFFGLIISLFLANLLVVPIKEILAITENLESGAEIKKPLVKRKDETTRIIQNISHLQKKILQIKKTQESAKIVLIQFINTLDFPVALIKIDGDIEIYNKHFSQFIGIEEKQGMWWEKIKNFEVNRIINKSIEKNENLEEEVNIDGKYFLCKAIPLPVNKELLLLMIDITDIRNMQEKRKEFLIAVSHELKTPLTAIKGYIETLKDEITEPEKQQYVDVIFHNTERMIKILEDIITLSKLETIDTNLETQEVDLIKIAKDVVMLYERKASQKGITIQLKTQKVPLIKGDGFKIEQMLVNLIDNAIKFTEKGKIEISIEYEEDTRNIKIIVEDTGIGIEREHLPHIFERFYVVDKSRSRKTGGTGLGLSIVKAIVLLHNGKIDVESAPGKGTKFIITLPF